MTDDRGADWLGFSEAVAAILGGVAPIGTERRAIDDALGFAVAEEVHSRTDHPAWDSSAMDGFAVRAPEVAGASPDAPVELPLSADIPAGSFPDGALEAGTAARVMTGAQVPEGATGVIRIEHTVPGGGPERVRFVKATDAERNLRRRGEDVRKGDLVASPGDELDPSRIGMLALAGHADVMVGRRPTIAVLATGDELADLDQIPMAIAGERLMNSNSHALAAQVRSAGGIPRLLGIARDTPTDVEEHLRAGMQCDAIVSTGGVSVGDHDHIKDVLQTLGAKRVFWRARIRPGSPIFFAHLGETPFFGLPGNPVSAMVTFEIFLRDAIRKMSGHRPLERRIDVVVRDEIRTDAGLTHFQRVRLERVEGGLPEARLTGSQSSGVLSSMSLADALLVVPEGTAVVTPGETAAAMLL